MLKMLLIVIHVLTYCQTVNSFIPNEFVELYSMLVGDSENHMEITEEAIEVALGEFLDDNESIFPLESQKFANIFTYLMARQTISSANSDVDMDLSTRNDPKFHFDNEEFNASNDNIIRMRNLVIENVWNSNMPQARKYLGNLLHTLQDFYSHSNWIELNNSKPFPHLGESDSIFSEDLVAGEDEVTCIDCESPDGTCANNLLSKFMQEKKLTSGYYEVPKAKGKCSHGGDFDSSRKKNATGGINKDSVSPDLSPHHYLHFEAANMAMKASKDFIINLINDDESSEWKMKMGELFGLSARVQKRDGRDAELISEFQSFTDNGKVYVILKTNTSASFPSTSFFVDSSVTKVVFTFLSSQIYDFQIINPKNNSSVPIAYLIDTNSTKSVEINSPMVGNWSVNVISSSIYSIQVTESSRIFFKYKITGVNGEMLKGYLLTNQTFLVHFICSELISFRSISLETLSKDGSLLEKNLVNESSNEFVAKIKVPYQEFQLKIFAETVGNETLERIMSPVIEPSNVQLDLKFAGNTYGVFEPGSTVNVSVTCVNKGQNVYFNLEITDSKNWSSSQVIGNLSLPPNVPINETFTFRIPNNTQSGEYSDVVLNLKSASGRLVNFASSSILVYDKKSDHIKPICSITSYTPNKSICDIPSNSTCSAKELTVYVEARDLESGLLKLEPERNITGAKFTSEQFLAGTKDFVRANYTLTCCEISAAIVAWDMNNNVEYCHATFVSASRRPSALLWLLVVPCLMLYSGIQLAF